MADDAIPHADVLGSNAQGQLKSIVERLERLAVEKAEIAEQEKEVLAEAAGNGFCKKTIKKVLARRKIDRAKLQEQEAMVDLYESALGSLPLFEPATPAAGKDSPKITVTVTNSDGSAVSAPLEVVGQVLDHMKAGDNDATLYAQAVEIVKTDRKASTSYIQRRLQLGYNKAAAFMERMQREGIVGPPDHAGKREILIQAEAA